MPIHPHTPIPLAPQALNTLGEAHSDTQPLGTAAPGSRDISPIVVEQVLPFLLSPGNVQIDKPQRIAAELLRPFQEQSKEIMLVLSQSKRLITARLAVLQETYLLADTPQSMLCSAYRGKVLLVVFPVLPAKRYILQTWIDEVYIDRLKLRYQDPRYDWRWKFEVAAPVALHVAPREFLCLIENHQVHLAREVAGLAEGIHAAGEACITDSATVLPQAGQSCAHLLFEATPPLWCSLRDISLGGMCLALQDAQPPEELANRMIQLHLTLPRIASECPGEAWIAMRLCLLGMIRHLNTTSRPWTLHIRFLKRLPAEFDMLFEASEQHFLTTQHPLA